MTLSVLPTREEHTLLQPRLRLKHGKRPAPVYKGKFPQETNLYAQCGSNKTYSGDIADYEQALSLLTYFDWRCCGLTYVDVNLLYKINLLWIQDNLKLL